MHVTPIKTRRITSGLINLLALIDESLADIRLENGSILAVTSKVVALCEGNVVPLTDSTKDELVANESDLYLPSTASKYGIHFTITDNTLIPAAGIDESNGDSNYVLWPKDAQKSANEIRKHLIKRFSHEHIGVVITDSTCHPLRRGTTGIAIAHSGFKALRNYVGTPDLFGKNFEVSQADVAGSLAATAVTVMGEGSEQTPLCTISDIPFVVFQDSDPTIEELATTRIPPDEDLFAPFLTNVRWEQGNRNSRNY